MSADNWDKCPNCKAIADKVSAGLKEKAAKCYGRIPAEDYLELMHKADNPTQLEDTLREDYEVGVNNDGLFEVSYSCRCDKCGFAYSFKESKKVQVPAVPTMAYEDR